MFSDAALCLMRLQAQCRMEMVVTGGVFWTHGLATAIEDALKRNVAYVLTMDYDTVFTPEDVYELVRLADEHPEADAIVPMQMRRENMFPLFTHGNNGAANGVVTFESLSKELMPIISGHFGLTLIRTSALNQLPKPWFLEVPDGSGAWSEDHPTKPRIDSDAWFWKSMRDAGMGIFLAPGVVVGHAELLITWPTPMLGPTYQKLTNYQTAGKPDGEIFDRKAVEAQIASTVEQIQEGVGNLEHHEGACVGSGAVEDR